MSLPNKTSDVGNTISSRRAVSRSSLASTSRKANSVPSSLRSSRFDFSSRGSSNIWSSSSKRSSGKRTKSSVGDPINYTKAMLHGKTKKQADMTSSNKVEIEREKSVPEELEILVDRCNNIEKSVVQTIKEVEQNHAKATADISEYRQQITNTLDEWEKNAKENVDRIMESDLTHLKSVLNECADLINKIKNSSEVSQDKTKLCDLNIKEIETKNTYTEYNFRRNNKISKFMKTETHIGEVEIKHTVPSLSHSSGLSFSLKSSRLDRMPSRKSSNIGLLQSRRSNSKMTSSVLGTSRSDKAIFDKNKKGQRPKFFQNNNKYVEELEILIARINDIKKTAVQNCKKAEQNHAAVATDINKFRKQINNVLDVWEKEAFENVNGILESDIAHLKSVMDKCLNFENEIQHLTEVTEYKTKLLEIDVIETEAKNTYRQYRFLNNDSISNLFKVETKIGNLEITHEVAGLYNNLKVLDEFVPKYLNEINVKAENDTFDCDITGMALIGTQRLVVADLANKSIKCVDTKRKQVTSQLRFSSAPWDVTMVHRGQLAVTVPSEKVIQYVFTMGSLKMGKHLKVNGECRGITYSRECLIVTFRSPGKIHIMDLQGCVLKIITQIGLQDKLFEWPDYVSVSKDGNFIYVSDWHRNAVTRLSLTGKVTGVYKDTIGTKMAGIAVASDGSVLVCKRTSHSIIKLSADCKLNDILLEEKHGLKYPWALCSVTRKENCMLIIIETATLLLSLKCNDNTYTNAK